MLTDLPASSYLEQAFLRWVLSKAALPSLKPLVHPQSEVEVQGHRYRVDYEVRGSQLRLAVELDGYAFHSHPTAFTHDRFRQNDLQVEGLVVVRFSYHAVKHETLRCVQQLQAFMRQDPQLQQHIHPNPVIEVPTMDDLPPSLHPDIVDYFDGVRSRLSFSTLRGCQVEALNALDGFFAAGKTHAALVMSVGAGKTALGVATVLKHTQRRALVVTPGSVIRGTFDQAFDHQRVGNALYGLPGGPLIPGSPPPNVLVLDRDDGPIREVPTERLRMADVIITNFHSIGMPGQEGSLLSKLRPQDIDLIIVDEAHIAAADSYQRLFQHFPAARTVLMSACFQRLDGRPIDAEVVYRYRLIDSVADGHAKNLQVHRFDPDPEQTTYEILWPDGLREEIRGRDAVLEVLGNERKLARVTAKSNEPIRSIMRTVRRLLDQQARKLTPVKPRVLFSALGERHAEQISLIANECGIPCDFLHHSMPEGRIKAVRERFESPSGDLQGLVQLRMLGQGYDFPPITVVVPFRPYSSFSEFYQFVGRGIRTIHHPAFTGRVKPGDQTLDVVYHAELGLDPHIQTICEENDMDPQAYGTTEDRKEGKTSEAGESSRDTHWHPEAFVLFEQGQLQERIIHDQQRVEQRRSERELEMFAQKYAQYASNTLNPVPFEQFVLIMRQIRD